MGGYGGRYIMYKSAGPKGHSCRLVPLTGGGEASDRWDAIS
jgi:hypothetical protein